MVMKHGYGALLTKVDLKHASGLCPVLRQDWPLLCYSWRSQFYFDLWLPFGLRSSPALLNRVAGGIEAVYRYHGATDTMHYLDDVITVGPPALEVSVCNKAIIIHTCHELGALVLDDKVEGLSTWLVVLGIEVDTIHWVMRLPDAKVREYQQSINEWTAHRAVTSRDLDSLLDKLFFASHMVRQSRTFLQRHVVFAPELAAISVLFVSTIALMPISSVGSIFYPDGMVGLLSLKQTGRLRRSWTSIRTRLVH